MKKKTGTVISIALIFALVLSLATTALAGSNSGGKGNSFGGSTQNKTPAASAQTRTPGNSSDDKAMENSMPGNGKSAGTGVGGLAVGMATDALEAAIEALSDEDKETLSEYIEAYEDAVAAAEEAMADAEEGDDFSEYRKAVFTALKELLEAAKDADIELKAPMSSAASMNGQLHRNWNGIDNYEAVEEAIAALSDDDKETLSDEIEAYEEAVAAAEEAAENAEDGEDLSEYREAVADALEELLAAAEDAGIDLGLDKPGNTFKNQKDIGKGFTACTQVISAAIAALSDDDADTLSDYIEAYEDAMAAAEEAEENADEDDDLSAYRKAVASALEDLLEAAKEADIELGLKEFACTNPDKRISGHFTDAVEEAIAALDDDDKETLSDEIDAFEAAVAAAEEAEENADEDDDLSTYREAVVSALKALLDAAKEADINLGLMKTSGR